MGRYKVRIIRRDFNGQTPDDWHATVTRKSDDVAFIWTSPFLWVLRLRTRRQFLDLDYKSYDRRQRKMKRVIEEEV